MKGGRGWVIKDFYHYVRTLRNCSPGLDCLVDGTLVLHWKGREGKGRGGKGRGGEGREGKAKKTLDTS